MSRDELHDGDHPHLPDEKSLDRRRFVKTVSAAGAVGAVGSLAASRMSAAPAPVAARDATPTAFVPQEAGDFARPDGLGPAPRAIPGSRFRFTIRSLRASDS